MAQLSFALYQAYENGFSVECLAERLSHRPISSQSESKLLVCVSSRQRIVTDTRSAGYLVNQPKRMPSSPNWNRSSATEKREPCPAEHLRHPSLCSATPPPSTTPRARCQTPDVVPGHLGSAAQPHSIRLWR